MSMAKEWLAGCLETHKTCRESSANLPVLPTRVIDVGAAGTNSEPFLYVPEGKRGEWVTLSHCWGNVRPFTTTTATLEINKASIPLAQLPPLFRDAVHLTRELGFQYLWIDSICILQDSLVDWTTESLSMNYVFRSCILTIAADCCPNSTVGIFDAANKPRIAPIYPVSLPVRWDSHDIRATIFPCPRNYDEDFSGPLNYRGWTLQEEILSPRLLRYASKATRWECRSTVQTEEYPICANENSRTRYEDHSQKNICLTLDEFARNEAQNQVTAVTKNDPLQTWKKIARQFAERNLTFATDTLPAISGVAREISRHLHDSYVAGLWKENILELLLWYSDGSTSRPTEYIAPSWAWTSLRMGFVLRWVSGDVFSKDMSWLCNIEDLSIQHQGPDPFGSVSGGILTLTAPIRKAIGNRELDHCDSVMPFFNNGAYDSSDIIGEKKFVKMILAGPRCSVQDRILYFGDTVQGDWNGRGPSLDISTIYAQICKCELDPSCGTGTYISALVLTLSDVERGYYSRVGYASIPEHLATGWESRTITLI